MNDREKLIEIVRNSLKKNIGKSCKLAENIVDDIIGAGVIVPPVYVGGTVYEIRRKAVSPSGRETNCGICTISFLKHCINIGSELYVKGKPYVKSDFYRLGKTVFLTREEAEKALEESEKK